MSTAYMLARKRDPLHEPIAESAQWWRLWLNGRYIPGENFAVTVTQVDNMDDPQVAAITFNDGLDEKITAEAARQATGEPRPRGNPLTSLISGDPCLDLLTVGPPTACPLWRPLTAPGNHRHPDQRAD